MITITGMDTPAGKAAEMAYRAENRIAPCRIAMQSVCHTRHANAVVCCYLQASLHKSHYPHGADMKTLNWRAATQQPETDAPITAILAARDEDGWCITSKYIWRANIGWRHERKSTPPPPGEFVWIPETELLATIAQ